MRDDLAAAVTMRTLLYGKLLSEALSTTAALRLPDALSKGPLSASSLAGRIGADPDAVDQLLRTLSAFDVFEHDEAANTFSLTPLGATLCTDAPGSARPTALLVGAQIGQAWTGLTQTVRSGRPAFDLVHGAGFFDYLDNDPLLRAEFDRSQACDLELGIEGIISAIPLAGVATIVDVGGGDGALLETLLSQSADTHGVLLDTEATVARATQRFDEAKISDRVEVIAGDFLREVPAGGDLYVLREILHDWDDKRCVTILRECRRAMTDRARLVVVEGVAADSKNAGGSELTALMDLYMMAVLRGRERTVRDYDGLFSAAGLRRVSMTRVHGRAAVMEVAVTPAN